MIKPITCMFFLLCMGIFICGAVWNASKQYEHERTMQAVVYKVEIKRMYDKNIYEFQQP